MSTSPESVPTTWTSADESFFRVAWDLFSPHFLAGAGALLASYDSDPVAVTAPSAPAVINAASVETPTRATA